MTTILKSISPVVALFLMLNGCQAVTGEPLGENINDTTDHNDGQNEARG
jgi:hypothetical protein